MVILKQMQDIDRLERWISSKGPMAVAYSGGCDSSLVALAVKRVHGTSSLAVMVVSPATPRMDINDARATTSTIGIDLVEIQMGGIWNELISGNDVERCYGCKREMMRLVKAAAKKRGFTTVTDGEVLEDSEDYRPGRRAADEQGVLHPLRDVGIGKTAVRRILKAEGLDIWRKPSSTCLATRIPYGQRVSKEKLDIIHRGEGVLRSMDFGDVRLRIHEMSDGSLIGVVEVDEVERAVEEWTAIRSRIPEIKLFLDPRGYRQGALNEGLELGDSR